jgi:hypothetical protein
MALAKSKECVAKISENAESCPRCGIKSARRGSRVWVDSLKVVFGTLTNDIRILTYSPLRRSLVRSGNHMPDRRSQAQTFCAIAYKRQGEDPT